MERFGGGLHGDVRNGILSVKLDRLSLHTTRYSMQIGDK